MTMYLRLGLLEDRGAAGVVVGVGVADEQDFDVGELEAKLLDAVADLRGRSFEVGVDEDVALRRDDEVGRRGPGCRRSTGCRRS